MFNKNCELQKFATSQHPPPRKGPNPVFNRRLVKCHQNKTKILNLYSSSLFFKDSRSVRPPRNPPEIHLHTLRHGTPGLDLVVRKHKLPIPIQIMLISTTTTK